MVRFPVSKQRDPGSNPVLGLPRLLNWSFLLSHGDMMAHRFYISACIFVVVRGAEIKFRHYDWLWELLRFNVLLTNLSAHREGGMPPPSLLAGRISTALFLVLLHWDGEPKASKLPHPIHRTVKGHPVVAPVLNAEEKYNSLIQVRPDLKYSLRN